MRAFDFAQDSLDIDGETQVRLLVPGPFVSELRLQESHDIIDHGLGAPCPCTLALS
jgi:hypothetical protein